MSSSTFKTKGLAELEKALVQMGKQAGFAALTGAMRDAARPIVKQTRNLVPVKTGETRKAVRVQVFKGKGKRDDVATLHIGFDKKRGWKGRFLETGAKPHRIPNKTVGRRKSKRKNTAVVAFGGIVRASADHPGVKAKPVLLPGFTSGYRQAIPIFARRLKERVILQAIKKYGKAA